MQQGGMNGMGGQRPPSGPMGNQRGLSAQEQIAFEQQKYEHQARRVSAPQGPRGHQQGQGPQSWEGMYDDVPQPEGSQGGRGGPARNNTPKPSKAPAAPAQPSNAPANAPTGPKNPGNKPGVNFRGGRGHGRYHPYGR